MRSLDSIRVLCLETLAGKPLSSMEHRKAIFKSTHLCLQSSLAMNTVRHFHGIFLNTTQFWTIMLFSAEPSWQGLLVSSVPQLCPNLCDPMNRSTPGLPVHHQLPELTQTHVHRVGDAIQAYHPLSSPFPATPNPFQHQGLFQWVSSSHEAAKLPELQL